jgi:ABC-type nitrate/sulfonate/bicarbonate transport system substrate-binding protein
MMRRSAVSVVLSLGFVLSVGAVFIPHRASTQTHLPITIGYQATADWLLFTERDLQPFEKAGLAPSFVEFVAGAPMIEAAQRQTIDVAAVGSVPFVIGLSQGVDWVMIGIHSEGAYAEGFVVRKDSGIDTPADLRGRRIGYFRGSTTHYGVMMVFRQVGIRPDQVTLLHLSLAEQVAAMAWEPWMQRMVYEANASIIATEGDIGIYTNVASYSVRRE